MNSNPPFVVNFSPFMGGSPQSVPQALWENFCSKATAEAMLSECQKIDPNAQMFDILDPKSRPPADVSRFPYPVTKTDPSSDVSVYVIVGDVALVKNLPSARLQEYAGILADTKAGTVIDFIDLEAQNLQGHVGKSRLFPYVSLVDLADATVYWADSPVFKENLAQ